MYEMAKKVSWHLAKKRLNIWFGNRKKIREISNDANCLLFYIILILGTQLYRCCLRETVDACGGYGPPKFSFLLFTPECRSAMRIAEILVVKDEK